MPSPKRRTPRSPRGVPVIRLHDLRHTQGTSLFMLPAMQADAARVIEQLSLRGPPSRSCHLLRCGLFAPTDPEEAVDAGGAGTGGAAFQAVLEVLSDGASSVVDVARRYGVARRTVHDWLRRYAAAGGEGWPIAARGRHRARSRWPSGRGPRGEGASGLSGVGAADDRFWLEREGVAPSPAQNDCPAPVSTMERTSGSGSASSGRRASRTLGLGR